MRRSLLLCLTCLLIGCNGGKSGSGDPETKSGSGNANAGAQDPFSKALDTARQLKVKGNIKEIAIAMQNYAETHGNMPSAGPDGKGLSWRVHLLPFLGQNALYHQFKLKEPWDSPHNRSLIANMPAFYNTPGTPNDGKTRYQVFVGKGTPFGGTNPPRFRDITDGSSKTIMAVFAGAEVEWTKPGGIEFNAGDPASAFGGMPEYGLIVALFDGASIILPANIDPKKLALLIQHADGQPVPGF